jgi:hypothetical protein
MIILQTEGNYIIFSKSKASAFVDGNDVELTLKKMWNWVLTRAQSDRVYTFVFSILAAWLLD